MIPKDNPVLSGTFNVIEIENEPEIEHSGSEIEQQTEFERKPYSLRSKETETMQTFYERIQKARENEKLKLGAPINVEVSRENVYQDMITLYKQQNIARHILNITFKKEEAVADGVTMDAFSSFFLLFIRN